VTGSKRNRDRHGGKGIGKKWRVKRPPEFANRENKSTSWDKVVIPRGGTRNSTMKPKTPKGSVSNESGVRREGEGGLLGKGNRCLREEEGNAKSSIPGKTPADQDATTGEEDFTKAAKS